MSGLIPPQLSTLTALSILDLSQSNIEGPILHWLPFFTNIVALKLARCRFTGPIPNAIGNLSSLVIFSVAQNQLSGQLPESFSGLSSLVAVDASDNLLTGSIPSMPPQVQVLALHNNKFTQLPELQNSSLCVLTIFGNEIRGSLTLPHMGTCAQIIGAKKAKPLYAPGATQQAFIGINLDDASTHTPVLYAQSNRLSCKVDCDQTNMSCFSRQKHSLLMAPGNELSLDTQVCPASMNATMARHW